MNNTMEIQIKDLVKSPLNVRKTTSATADEELKASILAHGLMQNLVVTEGKKGKYLVIAGGRRLEALKALQAEGKLPADHTVPCQIVDDENATEMSLAENIVRMAMHPADQFEAFAALIENGQTSEQVAQRFGVSRKAVEGRMKLARLAPELIQAYREEKLTLESLMAFTVTDDHQKQLSVFESLSEWDLERPDDIRAALTEEMVEAGDKRVRFVTLETYQAAGGTTKTDLFGEDVYLENPELLEALVAEKLKLVEQELMAEGWGWAQMDRERDWQATQGCRRIEAEPVDAPADLLAEKTKAESELEAAETAYYDDDGEDEALTKKLEDRQTAAEERVQEIEEKLESFVRFNPAQMATAGCFAYIDREGKLEIERGLVRRQDAKKAAQAVTDESGDEQPVEKPKGIPESLKRDLEVYRLGVAQAEIAKNPAIAFDLLVFKAAKSVIAMRSTSDGPNVAFHRDFGGNASKDARDFLRSQMEPIAKALPRKWLEHDSEPAQFEALQALTTEQKHAILAYCVASSLQPKLAPQGAAWDESSTAYDIALAQTGANVADYWRPTKDNFLSRINRDQLIEISDEILPQAMRWNTDARNAKKGAMVEKLDAAFAKSSNPDTWDTIRNWLPKGMAFGSAQEAKPVKAKKSKKAA